MHWLPQSKKVNFNAANKFKKVLMFFIDLKARLHTCVIYLRFHLGIKVVQVYIRER